MALSFGKMPMTPALRLTSRFSRSSGFVLAIRVQCSRRADMHRRLRSRFQVLQPEPFPKTGGNRQPHPRPRGSRYAKGSARGLLHHHHP